MLLRSRRATSAAKAVFELFAKVMQAVLDSTLAASPTTADADLTRGCRPPHSVWGAFAVALKGW